MSIHLMNQAWRAKLAMGMKFVLVAVCDTANDEGVCWPSIDTISRKCSMGERTVQRHLEALEAAGIISRAFRKGRSTTYQVHESKIPAETPAKLAPPQDRHPREDDTPANLAPTPAKSDGTPPPNSTETPAKLAPRTTNNLKENHQGSGRTPEPAPVDNSEPKASAHGARLPADWTLTRKLALWALQEQPTWNGEHVRKVADAFRDHWIAQPGVKGRKTDWEATWRNWVRKEPALKAGAQTAAGVVVPGNWWEGDAGINAKGAELNVARHKDEPTPMYLLRVAKIAGRGPWIDHILRHARTSGQRWFDQVVATLGDGLLPTDF